jgi:hypothetical protein
MDDGGGGTWRMCISPVHRVRAAAGAWRWRKWMEELSSHDDAHRRLLTPILYYKQVYQLEKIEEH